MSNSFSFKVGQEGSAEWAGDGASYPGKITEARSKPGHANEYHMAFTGNEVSGDEVSGDDETACLQAPLPPPKPRRPTKKALPMS